MAARAAAASAAIKKEQSKHPHADHDQSPRGKKRSTSAHGAHLDHIFHATNEKVTYSDDVPSVDTDLTSLTQEIEELAVAQSYMGLPYQQQCLDIYLSSPIQLFVAFLIFVNFIVSAISAQIHPKEGTRAGDIFFVFEWFFGIIFTIELVWNMYGSWFRPFWSSGWNWFDFVIVLISMMALTMSGLPGIAILRLFRAFRVFRLFKRIESLRMIIEGVIASLPGVLNAFLVLGILMGIWSIMGVEFFQAAAYEEFGNFGRGMWTMWQTMTMDAWSSGIARPIIFDSNLAVGIPFFVSFIFIGGIVMTNVVVAILLDKYLEVSTHQKEEKQKKKEQKERERAESGSKGSSKNGSKNGSKNPTPRPQANGSNNGKGDPLPQPPPGQGAQVKVQCVNTPTEVVDIYSTPAKPASHHHHVSEFGRPTDLPMVGPAGVTHDEDVRQVAAKIATMDALEIATVINIASKYLADASVRAAGGAGPRGGINVCG